MTDVLTPEQRRRCMAAIRGKDTKPEMTVRKLVHAMGYRYRLHRKDLPGKPDLVFASRKKVIFVHGCFWNMHNCRYGRVQPKANAEFWQNKREATVARDQRNRRMLSKYGWEALTLWECQTTYPELLSGKIVQFLTKQKSALGA
jgi:DNA mismatch endonuclease (patch repair protein)